MNPGDILEWLIIKVTGLPPNESACKRCENHKKQLDLWGWWGCWKHRKEIWFWLRQEAEIRGIIVSEASFLELFKTAIKEAAKRHG